MKKIIVIGCILIAANVFSQQIADGHAPIISEFNVPLGSGIYQGSNPTGITPDNSTTWQYLFVMRNATTSNNYQLQIASSFTINDKLFFRKIAVNDLSTTYATWIELATRGTNNFIGNQSISGNLSIGTTTPNAKLDVNGTIHSKEVKVDMEGWPDYVFKKEYALPTLEEVEKHIKEKGHLENIPNEKEVLINGISLGEMNVKLLQKIEELTLYMIEMKKENQKMKEDILELKQHKQ